MTIHKTDIENMQVPLSAIARASSHTITRNQKTKAMSDKAYMSEVLRQRRWRKVEQCCIHMQKTEELIFHQETGVKKNKWWQINAKLLLLPFHQKRKLNVKHRQIIHNYDIQTHRRKLSLDRSDCCQLWCLHYWRRGVLLFGCCSLHPIHLNGIT